MKLNKKDRRDGKRVRNLDGMHAIMPYIKPKRCDSDVYINTKIDMTNLVKYMDDLKKIYPEKKITYFHLFSMAIAKTFFNRPLLNRYIINKKYYDKYDVTLGFVAKVSFDDISKELMTNIVVDPSWSVFELADDVYNRVNKIRTSKNENDTDGAVNMVGSLPKPLLSLAMKIVKFADNHDMVPSSWTKDLIYYSSCIVSNLGSINCGSIYHNLTDLGTNSILFTMGKIHKESSVDDKDKVVVRNVCDFGINLDERIADGFYFAKSIQLFEYILNNPKLLEGRADDIINIDSKKKNK